MAFFKMDPLIFRKGDAPYVLMVQKTWAEVLDKPENLVPAMECAARLISAAKEQGLLSRPDKLKTVKEVITKVFLQQLQAVAAADETYSNTSSSQNIIADAFWDEIIGTDLSWGENTERISAMIEALTNAAGLTKQSSLGDVKFFFNENILKPLKGMKDAADSE